MNRPLTLLCLASFHKGFEFLREAKRQGCKVFLVTSESLRDADWPRDSLDDIFYVPDDRKRWRLDDLILGVSHLARSQTIDCIVALDDFDLEKASALREHLRVSGMGETTTRLFRDKLAMRVRAQDRGIPVPPFVHILNDQRIRTFCRDVSPPWMVKPRHQAGAIGLRKVHGEDELWSVLDALGDRRSWYLLEAFVSGDVYHVDSIVRDQRVLFAAVSRYGTPPFDVSHSGGVFTTKLVERGGEEEQSATAINADVLREFGLRHGVSHTEFIRGTDGGWRFLETSARVGGAHIAELVEAACGLNLWAEWAKLEILGADYRLPVLRHDYAGLLVSLAREEWPDHSGYDAPEVVWRLEKRHHAGLIVRSPDPSRVDALIAEYASRVHRDLTAAWPPVASAHD